MAEREQFEYGCTYCLKSVDIRDEDVDRRVICWWSKEATEDHNQTSIGALPVLLNEYAHAECVRRRAISRAADLEAAKRRTSDGTDR